MKIATILFLKSLLFLCFMAGLQAQDRTDSNTPLHLLRPDYVTQYGVPSESDIVAVLDRITNYLEATTPSQMVDETGKELTDLKDIQSAKRLRFAESDFRLISYEWGVTYAGMLLASQVTGDTKYAGYTFERMKFLAGARPYFMEYETRHPDIRHPLTSVLHPHTLDDAGSMCAAMIKTKRTGSGLDLDPMIDTTINHISQNQFRLEDGTLARNRPHPNTLWLDDLFMSVPALAQMGKYTGEYKYFDDAVKQVLQFSERMFIEEKGLFIHGWVMGMEEHPAYHWARANGWAIMAIVELLEVLPADHPQRGDVLHLLQQHIRGLAGYQSPFGFWHQLIDRNDSYLETSATAIFTYSIARAVNRGYVDAKVYGPMVCLAWNAVASKVNEQGQVEGTCVGTGMGFDPAFYYYRPVSRFAAHGYGPTILAGAEMIALLKQTNPNSNDSSIQFYDRKIKAEGAIFNIED
ncbi:MAG: glycoside hydrolase family 88 protein [Bacteroidales bacterium]|nr:glycoside hydrolase family 88 protein [Bacteroidales bacterium]